MNWASHRFRAMGSEIVFWLDAPSTVAAPAFRRAEQLFEEVEAALSRFRPESELMQLNARPERFVPVSPILWEVASVALSLARETGGLFDPTLLPAILAAGYDRDFAARRCCKAPGLATASEPLGGMWRQVRSDQRRRALWLPAGAALDFGGIAKGYTAGRAVRLLRAAGPCLVDAGGDLSAGGAPTGLRGWPVAIAKPGAAEEELLQLWLVEASLATSGIDFRRWQHQGQMAHHLIDPRTGAPAQTDLLTVSVLACDSMAAEAWATAAMVAGREEGYKLLTRRELDGAFVAQDGSLLLTPGLAELGSPER